MPVFVSSTYTKPIYVDMMWVNYELRQLVRTDIKKKERKKTNNVICRVNIQSLLDFLILPYSHQQAKCDIPDLNERLSEWKKGFFQTNNSTKREIEKRREEEKETK